MITVKFNDRQVQDTLSQLTTKAQNLRPAFAEIGEDLTETTKRRFNTATAPDGKAWAANSAVTIARYLGNYGKSFKKDGSLSKAGAARSASKKPLTGETRTLASTINYQLNGKSSVSVGSPKVQAAMMQYGGTKAQFPHLWGNIPARPFLGVSSTDRTNILDILADYLK